MAYFLRLIGPVTRRELDIIRTIRNECAHNMNPVSFDTEPTISRCRALAEQRNPRLVLEDEAGKVFMATVSLLVAAFWKASIVQLVDMPVAPNEELARLVALIET